jgi:hypothetical protein
LTTKIAAVAALATAVTLAAGCGGSHPGTTAHSTTRAASGASKCTLTAKQRAAIRRANRMIADMHRLDQKLKTVHQHGPMKLELELNRFLLSIGFLPLNERSLLIRKAKSAVGLCRDCFDALEAVEPAIRPAPCTSGL